MKKLCMLLLAICILLTGCSPAAETAANSEDTVTFMDDLGRTVTINQPKRVAVLLGSYAEAWTLAGGSICAAADDVWEEYDLDLPEDVVNLGNTKSLSLELLFAAQPDFVIGSTGSSQHLQWQETLESAGIPVAYFEVASFEDYLRVLEIFTDITGKKDRYRTNGLDVETQIAEIRERRNAAGDTPTVLVLRSSASGIRAKATEGNVLGEILADLGCVNIADSDDSLLENLSVEHILLADPDYVFITQHGDDTAGIQANVEQFIAENPAWSQLTAVKNDRVYFMEKALFTLKPNHRWGDAYARVEEILSNG